MSLTEVLMCCFSGIQPLWQRGFGGTCLRRKEAGKLSDQCCGGGFSLELFCFNPSGLLVVNCSFKQENSLVYSGTYSTKLSDTVFFLFLPFCFIYWRTKLKAHKKIIIFLFSSHLNKWFEPVTGFVTSIWIRVASVAAFRFYWCTVPCKSSRLVFTFTKVLDDHFMHFTTFFFFLQVACQAWTFHWFDHMAALPGFL